MFTWAGVWTGTLVLPGSVASHILLDSFQGDEGHALIETVGRKMGVFDPVAAIRIKTHTPLMANFKGEPVQAPASRRTPTAAQVLSGDAESSLDRLRFPDPNHLVAGGFHEQFVE